MFIGEIERLQKATTTDNNNSNLNAKQSIKRKSLYEAYCDKMAAKAQANDDEKNLQAKKSKITE